MFYIITLILLSLNNLQSSGSGSGSGSGTEKYPGSRELVSKSAVTLVALTSLPVSVRAVSGSGSGSRFKQLLADDSCWHPEILCRLGSFLTGKDLASLFTTCRTHQEKKIYLLSSRKRLSLIRRPARVVVQTFLHLEPILNELRVLDLSHTYLGPSGARILFPALRLMSELRELDLSGNRIGPAGARALAKVLGSMPRLHTLSLSRNNLGPVGARILFPSLEAMTGLKVLNLDANNLGLAGARALVPVLEAMTALRVLKIG